MAGAISSVAVRKGQKVAAGERLLTVEAMKMETAITAAKAGIVADVLVSARDHVDAKDLMIIMA